MVGKLKKLTPENVQDAVAFYERGESLGAVAERFAVSRQAMHDLLKRRIPMRSNLRFGADNHFHRGTQKNEAANNQVEKAILAGKLVPEPCEVCGENGVMKDGRRKVQAHHDDYNKPLEVRWLCQPHHHEWHKHNKAIPVRDE